ncbi:MAG: hypothetical protein M3Y74_16755 [Chloroflexota bacterium]|nr:hypothetical protein [Chloroflexota bacterium]
MSDEERRAAGDAAVEQRLRELGPLVQRLEQIEGETAAPTFVRDLRARLLLGEAAVADERDEGLTPTRSSAGGGADSRRPYIQGTRRARPALWAVVAAVALVAVLVALVVVPRWNGQRPGAANVAASLPRLSIADLTRDYPFPPGQGAGGGGPVTPANSAFDPDPVPLYYGPLRLTAGALPRTDDPLLAYQLDAPLGSARLTALARSLGIPDRVTRARAGGAIWLVAANATGLPGPHVPPLHSLAVSTTTGEVIYHDLRYPNVDPRQHIPSQAQAVAEARAWLTRLGWPGQRMPVLSAKNTFGPWFIDLGWTGVDATTTPAAIVAVAPGGHVDDARLWPPLAHLYQAPARTVRVAWTALHGGTIPLAVTETDQRALFTPTGGQGTVRRVDVVQVLAPGAHGRTYLVPAYRFAGTAHLAGGAASAAGSMNATWYALVPALQR